MILILILATTYISCDQSQSVGSCLQTQTESEELFNIRELVDLDKYPIDKPDSTAYDDLIEFCHAQLKSFGSVDLPGFIREEVLQKMAEEVCWHQNTRKTLGLSSKLYYW